MPVAALARPRTALLLALLAIAALAAFILTSPPPASAAPPSNLVLDVSLIEDVDNIVPPGGTARVRATLSYVSDTRQEIEIKSGTVRVTGSQEFDADGRSKAEVSGQIMLQDGAKFEGGALHDDTLVVSVVPTDFNDPNYHGRYNRRDGVVMVFEAESGRQIAQILPPAGAAARAFGDRVAVWQENASTAWVFIGSPRDPLPRTVDRSGWNWPEAWAVTGATRHLNNHPGGSVWIYKIDRTPNAASPARQVGRIKPKEGPAQTASATRGNGPDTNYRTADDAYLAHALGYGGHGGTFGDALAITSDGSTLLVANPRTTDVEGGAVWIFEKPTNGWGTNFTSAATADAINTGTPATAKLSDTTADRGSWTGFGYSVAIADDTKDWIVVGAPFRQLFPSGAGGSTTLTQDTTDPPHKYGWLARPPGFPRDNDNAGSVHVFKKPSGGWSTLTAAQSTTPNADLYIKPDNFAQRIGQHVAITANGNAIAASAPSLPLNPEAGPGFAVIWDKPTGTPGDWADSNNAGHVKLTRVGGRDYEEFSHGGVSFNNDGTKLVVGNPYRHEQEDAMPWAGSDPWSRTSKGSGHGNDFQGEAWVFSRTSNTTAWGTTARTTDHASATQLLSPDPADNAFFGGAARYELGGNRLMISQSERHSRYEITSGAGAVWLLTNPGSSTAPVQTHKLIRAAGCSGIELDDDTTWTCPLRLGDPAPSITIPPGTTGSFVVSVTLKLDNDDNPDITLTDTITVKVGTVNEAASAKFEIAKYRPDPVKSATEDYKDTIAATGENTFTRMQLSILNENDKASGAGAVSALFFTTNAGTLTLVSPAGAAMANSCNGLTCQVDVSKLNSDNSDKITVQLAHPGEGKSGTATVRAQVLPTIGGMQLAVDPVTITLAGEPDTIAISEPATGVLNVNTTVLTGIIPNTNEEIRSDDAETRDRLRLSVSAQDESGNKADTPTDTTDNPRITITDPDGKPVSEDSIARIFPLKNAAGNANLLDADGDPQIEIDVDAPPTDKLKTGEYKITLRTGDLTTSQTFAVSGDPANIAVSEPDGDLTVNGRFTITATITDDGGTAVPDGTPVTFADNPTATTPVLVNLSRGTITEDGQASATYLVISAGRGYVTVTSGDASTATLVTTGAAVTTPTEPTNPADSLSSTRVNGFSTWTGTGTTTASALLADIDNGVDSILLWSNGQWLRYGLSDGRKIPGSMNFEVRRGAILWLGNGG